ncbi:MULTISPECIES: hypothetical protein, partial [unclassified Pseudarthrobacter]|uniref:hypothetical protein n=1 Tax=unclassified Pseudarthrobacter TaxID=2647000 RepID=UPI003630ACD4
LDKTGKYGRITSVKVAQFSAREMAQFSTIADMSSASVARTSVLPDFQNVRPGFAQRRMWHSRGL